jgi:hypothetical protein
VALAACCRSALGYVHIRLRATRAGRSFQCRRRPPRPRCPRVRGQLEYRWRHREREHQGSRLQSVHSFGSQGFRQQQQQQQEEETPASPSILSQSVQSEDTTSRRSTTTWAVALAQAMSEASSRVQTRALTPGAPIFSSLSPPPPQSSSPHPPGDLSTVPASFVTAPPTIVSRTTDPSGDGRTPEIRRGYWWHGTLRAGAHVGVIHSCLTALIWVGAFSFFVSRCCCLLAIFFGFPLLAVLSSCCLFSLPLTLPLLPLHRTRPTLLNPYLLLRVHVLRYLLATSSPLAHVYPLHATLMSCKAL